MNCLTSIFISLEKYIIAENSNFLTVTVPTVYPVNRYNSDVQEDSEQSLSNGVPNTPFNRDRIKKLKKQQCFQVKLLLYY